MIKKKAPITKTMDEAMQRFPHFKEYVERFQQKEAAPKYIIELDRSMAKMEYPNFVYPVGDPIFIHMFRRKGENIKYQVIEPRMKDEQTKKYNLIMDKMVEIANTLPVPDSVLDIGDVLIELYEKLIVIGALSDDALSKLRQKMNPKVHVSPEEDKIFRYFIIRNRVGYGKLDPLFKDPWLEDIHCTGVGRVTCIHKIFGMVYTSLVFKDDLELDGYIIETTERVERPASDTHSIVDAMMPDGSRANFIYGRDVSLEGSSFTLRKFSEVPVSVTQLVSWGTMSSEIAAYMWICLENGMNAFVCGETASGKTTTLNAVATFIKPEAKVFTVENTPEVTMPHTTWQHLLTREVGKSSDVTYFDLLAASLRSRPNYIIVGEIRGKEGNIAFQAMQTGHPVMSTFHAGSVTTMVQRLTGDPINVPIAFIDNLNICLIQMAVYHGGRFVRRVLSVAEIERYYAPANKMVTREVFTWNPVNDLHIFRGLFNSYLLEVKIAKILGYEDSRDIYLELKLRKKILDKMVENRIFNYYEVWDLIKNFHEGGLDTLPFSIGEDPRKERKGGAPS